MCACADVWVAGGTVITCRGRLCSGLYRHDGLLSTHSKGRRRTGPLQGTSCCILPAFGKYVCVHVRMWIVLLLQGSGIYQVSLALAQGPWHGSLHKNPAARHKMGQDSLHEVVTSLCEKIIHTTMVHAVCLFANTFVECLVAGRRLHQLKIPALSALVNHMLLLLSLTLPTVIMHFGHSLQPYCWRTRESIKCKQNSNKHISETDMSCGQLIINQDFVAKSRWRCLKTAI